MKAASPVDHFKVTMTVRVPVWLRKAIDRTAESRHVSANAVVSEALVDYLGVEPPA